MLTLLEAPGSKKLRGVLADEDFDEEEEDNGFDDEEDEQDWTEDDEEEYGEPLEPNCVERCFAMGQSPTEPDLSDKWKQEFSKRPTWFHADLALHQILRANATGFRWPLYSRILIQRFLFRTGCFVQRHAWLIIVAVLALFSFFCYGLRYVHIETDIVKLWVSEDGRLNGELNFLNTVQNEYRRNHTPDAAYERAHFLPEDTDERLSQIPEDEAPTAAYQVLIQTAAHDTPSRNVLTRKELLRHVQLMLEITQLRVEKFGLNWTLEDICFKPGELDIDRQSMAYALKPTLERLIPCIWITPIDCFFEGAKPLGPHPPIDTRNIPLGGLLRLLVTNLPDSASWANLDPEQIMNTSGFDLGTIMNFFLRSGIGKGYLNRPCIDPLDPECPKTAPNHYQAACRALEYFEHRILAPNGRKLDEVLGQYKIVEEKKTTSGPETSALDILGALFGGGSNKKASNTSASENKCAKHKAAFMRWLCANLEQYGAKFPKELLPNFPNYGNVMRGGCSGVAANVMKWPAKMILGGLHNKQFPNGDIEAEALQSVILVSTPTEVFRRFKDSSKFAGNATRAQDWSPLVAREVISAWARAFTDSLYNHDFNRDGLNYIDHSRRVVHPLASTSISDMLAEFCDFNYAIILAGYLLMLVYALYSQCRFDGCCSLGVESAVGLALAGVFTVTMASVAGLGLATWMGINFNAATTQIVPFLALGIGVDNMFLLLHNYPQVVGSVSRNELGFLMRETGMSILTTSLNNIFAFWAGTILPIPALRSFCGQTAILLTTNLFGIFFIYPAFIALDLKRRKAGRRDMAFLCYYCCCMDDDAADTVSQGTNATATNPKDTSSERKLINKTPTAATTRPFIGDDDDPPYSRRVLSPQVLIGTPRDEEEARKQQRRQRRQRQKMKRQKYKLYTLHGFLHLVYIPLLKRRPVKIAILLCMFCLFVLGVYGISRSTIGLELSDVLPENTAPAAFLQTRDKFFSFYPMAMVLRGEHIDFPAQQHQIDLLRRDIGLSRFVVKLPDGEPSERYWLQMFRDWLRGMQAKLDAAQRDGLLADFDATLANSTSTTPKSPDLQIAYSLACSYGHKYDCSRVGNVRLIDQSGTINAEGFYNYLYGWHEYEQMFYSVSQASFYPRLRKLRQGPSGRMKYRYFIPPAPRPLFSRIPFYCDGLRDTPTIMQMIREIRTISDNYTSLGLPNYPEGVAFTFWEQYLSLKYYLALAIGIISVSVFCVISAIIFNPWTAAVVTCVVVSMTVELAGFMGLAGVKLNPISAVTLITAVGIGVEFTAHVVLAFLTSMGSRHARMVKCLEHMFIPVIHGGMPTLLGIIMLAFSDFDFVVQYFFVVLTALVIIGLFNGLAVLPVLLSYIGPPCEIHPNNGRNRLPFPTSQRHHHRNCPAAVVISSSPAASVV